MNPTRACLAVASLLMILGAGCNGPNGAGDMNNGQMTQQDLDSGRRVVESAVEAIGGAEKWRSVRPLRAKALVTVYDAQGAAYVSLQDHVIDLNAGRIDASGQAAADQGWALTVREDGSGQFVQGESALRPEHRRLLLDSLSLLAHRLRGPVNLTRGPGTPVSAETVSLRGRRLIRVGVANDPQGTQAYYFDPDSRLLHMVTAGGDAVGEDGTVALYDYELLVSRGIGFPKRVRIVRIGDFSLVGQQPVVDVEYQRVE